MAKKKQTKRGKASRRTRVVTEVVRSPEAAARDSARKGKAKAAAKKPAGKAKAKAAPFKKSGKLSGLDAAAKVLGEAKEPLATKDMVEQMLAKGYWKTGGKTPAATIYAAIIREIAKKGSDARFKKTERGKFALAK